jgi:SpoIID/LytB domain protein
LDLTPLERGASGRLRRLLVRTDAGDFTLGKELAIRLALSATCLYSAAIVLDWEGDTLLIRGKGWGHGVGLCQLGATRMALEGRPWREILAHYYPHTALVAIRQAEAP